MDALVKFPLTSPTGVVGAALQVSRLRQLDSRTRNVRAPELPRGTLGLVESARDAEPAGALKLQGIGVRVKGVARQPTGLSFGLALGLADKIARHGITSQFAEREIWATGIISPGASGEIETVEQFSEKVDFIIEAARTESISFFYPATQQDVVIAALAAKTDLVNTLDIEFLPVSHISDAEALWSKKLPQIADELIETGSRKLWPWVGVAVVALIGVGILTVMRGPDTTALVTACEEAAIPLNVNEPEPSAIAHAKDVCETALVSLPDDGRLYFVMGQVEASQDNTLQARQNWQKAADLGNADGLAAIAYIRWISAPTDKVEVLRAIQMLETSAARGSEDAPKLLATILMDGRALLPDPIRAEYWIGKTNETQN